MNNPIDLVHNNDKTATYKLALLRALIDIAGNQPQVTSIASDGRVQVPYPPIVDLWITYYYPLLQQGIPQLPLGRKPAFMETMLRTGRKCSANTADEILRKPTKLRELRKEVREILHKGPVYYARDPRNNRLFEEYKLEGGKFWEGILVPADLWKEITLNGISIRETLVAEWDKLSAEFAEAKPEQA